MKKKIILSGVVAGMIFLGCGTTTGTDDTKSVSGVVADGYIKNAKVCIDTNLNGKCDANESYAYTNDNGAYSINYDGNLTGQLVVQSGGYDVERKVTVNTPYVAPAENINITPLVNMTYLYAKDNNTTFDDAKLKIAKSLGIDSAYITANPVTTATIKPITIKIQGAVDAMMETNASLNGENLYKEIAANLITSTGNTFDEKLQNCINDMNISDNAKKSAEAMIDVINNLLSDNTLDAYSSALDTIKNNVGLLSSMTVSQLENLMNDNVNNYISSLNTDTSSASTSLPTSVTINEMQAIDSNVTQTIAKVDDLKNVAQEQNATVNNAKTTISNIRDTIEEILDPSIMGISNQENNSSTLIGNIISNYNGSLNPAIRNISDQLSGISETVSDSVKNFDTQTKLDFNDTLTKLSDRIDAIGHVFDSYEENQSFSDINTTYGDTVSYSYSNDGTYINKTYTINGQSINVKYPVNDMNMPNETELSGNIKLSDENYTLDLSSLNYSNGTFDAEGNVNIKGENSSNITGNMKFAFNINNDEFNTGYILNSLNNVNIQIDGEITTDNNQTFKGLFTLNDSGLSLSGVYSDSNNNVNLDGNISVNISSSNWKTYLDQQDSVLNDDWDFGSKIYKVNGEIVGSMDINWDTNEVNITTLGGENYICDYQWNDKFEINCSDANVTVDNLAGKVVEFNIGGTNYLADDLYYEWTEGNKAKLSISLEPYKNSLIFNDQTAKFDYVEYSDNGGAAQVMASYDTLVYKEVTPVNAEDILGGIKFSGNVDVNGTTATLSLAADHTDVNTTNFYISDLTLNSQNLSVSSPQLITLSVGNDGVEYAVMNDLNVDINDTNNNIAKIENLTAEYTQDTNTVKAYGKISYLDSSFTGYTMLSDYNGSIIGKIYGEIDKEGFEPFTISAYGSGDKNTTGLIYIYLTKGTYQLGGTIKTDKNGTVINMYDTNGVFTNIDSEDNSSSTVVLSDSNGNQLADVNSSENNWEITYSDGTTETLY